MEDNIIDMIYFDPPFFTQKIQCMKDSNGVEYSFSDIWSTKGEYLDYMRVRINEIKRVLKKTGSVFLHCDNSASHYLRMVLDDEFGENNFRSEIIWTYKRWSNAKKGLLPSHQTIFFYSKTNHFKFNTIYNEYSPTTNIDQILQERVRNNKGKASYKYDKQGNIVIAKEKKGVPMSDVWEIPFLNPKAKERTGYPTQKPIELLEKIIQISTDEGDIVLDPFCGSGTTLVAAKILNRNYIGIDKNASAIALCKQRLDAPVKTVSKLLQVGADAYKTKNDEELAILHMLECDVVQRNRGIDGFLKKHYLDAPVAVKIQKSYESFSEAVELLNNAGKRKKCSFTVMIRTSEGLVDSEIAIPSNMIVIDGLNLQLNSSLARVSNG
ncbi:MAG: site-specific DNA-methyltransferase [Lachnospiraceae bacterium]|nr:site-specific DNA-methyltransferase [Lachnospiraceae bacterium]